MIRYYNNKQLYRRGWKLDWITQYLKEPDIMDGERPCWEAKKVENIEKNTDVRLLFLTIKKGKFYETREHKQQHQDCLGLIRKSLKLYGQYTPEQLRDIAHKISPEKALDPIGILHIIINYLRHEQSSYDKILEKFCNKEAPWSVKKYLFARVLSLIATKYPFLEKECYNQSRTKDSQHLFLKFVQDKQDTNKAQEFCASFEQKEAPKPQGSFLEWAKRVRNRVFEKMQKFDPKNPKQISEHNFYKKYHKYLETLVSCVETKTHMQQNLNFQLFLRQNYKDFYFKFLEYQKGALHE
ncbi:MAG: hypothetical protein WC511_01845 [Candidatus Pacearchaeota archaeon]